MNAKGFKDIDSYIQTFPKDVQALLQQLRKTIQKAAPQAEEAISYQMPTFKLNGNLVHFAAYKNHIGFYPAPSGLTEFQKEISKYKHSKGAVQFPLDQPLPLRLITQIVKFRVKENLKRVKKQGN
ncbi:MAG: iron chaperone [Cyclobacteriaceae bacterium]